MKKLRWVMDGGFWDVDVSTPMTVDGVARPVPGDILPLGLSRGTRLSRPTQIDFFQRFMSAPFVPSYSGRGHGFAVERVLTPPFSFSQHWFPSLLGQFNLQKFMTTIKENGFMLPSESSWLQSLERHLKDKSLYALNLCSELLITHETTLLAGLEAHGAENKPRKKAVLQHKLPHQNLTLEAAWPGLFIDKHGAYWDVPFTMAVDLASVPADSDSSYHVCINHNAGSAKQCDSQHTDGTAATLLSGWCAKAAFSFKKTAYIWKSDASKLKLVQPYDVFLSNPHISTTGILGAVVTASLGDGSVRAEAEDYPLGFRKFSLHARRADSAIIADIFASVSLSAQHGNFQRLFLDLTRLYGRMDFPSGSKFLSGATRLAQDLYYSRALSLEAVEAMCPNATLSFQQQIGGPFSFRVDSGVTLDLKNRDRYFRMNDPVFAVEYALQVLGSAKAVAWYSLKQREFMIELRFYES